MFHYEALSKSLLGVSRSASIEGSKRRFADVEISDEGENNDIDDDPFMVALETDDDLPDGIADCDENLSEQTKRLKISSTPGQLRLKKDVDSLPMLHGIVITRLAHPSEITVCFVDDLSLGQVCPSRFLITVPKYYPHSPPSVRSLENGIFSHPLISLEDGQVLHPSLTSHWSPLCSLLDVLQTIRNVRLLFILPSFSAPPAQHFTPSESGASTMEIPTSKQP